MSRPVIGISMYREPASWGSWERVPANLSPARYADAVHAGGGTPVLIPPFGPGDDAIDVVRRLDGLIIAGGADVNPSRYAAEPHAATAGWRDDRDVTEFALLDAADDIELPVLGICRGMQVMAVRAGGSLHQHVPDVVGHEQHSLGPGRYGPIEVSVEPESRLAELVGERLTVPCHHHQAVDHHPGFRITARADDGLPEAMEAPGSRFVLAVQWHPETDTDMRLFTGLTAACREVVSGRG